MCCYSFRNKKISTTLKTFNCCQCLPPHNSEALAALAHGKYTLCNTICVEDVEIHFKLILNGK